MFFCFLFADNRRNSQGNNTKKKKVLEKNEEIKNYKCLESKPHFFLNQKVDHRHKQVKIYKGGSSRKEKQKEKQGDEEGGEEWEWEKKNEKKA